MLTKVKKRYRKEVFGLQDGSFVYNALIYNGSLNKAEISFLKQFSEIVGIYTNIEDNTLLIRLYTTFYTSIDREYFLNIGDMVISKTSAESNQKWVIVIRSHEIDSKFEFEEPNVIGIKKYTLIDELTRTTVTGYGFEYKGCSKTTEYETRLIDWVKDQGTHNIFEDGNQLVVEYIEGSEDDYDQTWADVGDFVFIYRNEKTGGYCITILDYEESFKTGILKELNHATKVKS